MSAAASTAAASTEASVIAGIAAVVLIAFLAGGAVAITRKEPEFLGHPKGLYMLFFAEMWERFSYYGMRALLIFYLTKHWLFKAGEANLVYGAYTSLVYITPVLGGYLADKYLGQRKAVLFGAVLLTAGHMLMAFEGTPGPDNPMITIFWLALSCIIVGSGFLKANISVMVGQLYPKTDFRRDSAYTIFYVGINLGAAIGTILAGYLGETYGWKYGFGAAGIGMLLGLIVFVWGKPLLNGVGEAPNPQVLVEKRFGLKVEHLIYAVGIAALGIMWMLIQYQSVIQSLLIVSGLALLFYVLTVALFQLPYGSFSKAPEASVMTYLLGAFTVAVSIAIWLAKPDIWPFLIPAFAVGAGAVIATIVQQYFTKTDHARDRLFAILFLIALNPLFWGLFEQAGGSLNLYTDKFVDRGGVPASLFQSINPIYIIILGPLFAWLWIWLGKRGLEPSAPAKFGLALLQVGLGFLVMVWGAKAVGMGIATPVIFIFLIYLLHTTGELCLSPVGLSAMNRLAPHHLASLIMGAWFYMTAVGNFVAGKIGEATAGEGGEMSKELTLQVYNKIGWITIGAAVVVLLLSGIVKRWMHLDTLKDEEPAKGA